MNETILVAVISVMGTIVGSFFGVLSTAKMTQYRLERLEKKVDLHNNVVERMAVAENKIDVADHRIEDLEITTEKIREGGIR